MMLRRVSALMVVGWINCVASGSVSAQVFESLGVRALGMGGAFVAVADDATAMYWNPAGLATGALVSLTFDRQMIEVVPGDVPQQGVNDGSSTIFGLSIPALGLTYYRLRSSEVRPAATAVDASSGRPLVLGSLITHHTGLTLVQSIAQGAAVGTTVKFVRGVAALQLHEEALHPADALDLAAALIGRASNRLDVDVGAMATFSHGRAGIVVRNVRAPEFPTFGPEHLALSRQVRAGVAAMPFERLTLALDLDLTRTEMMNGERRNLAVGAEHWLADRYGIRAGLRLNTTEDVVPSVAVGGSVAVRPAIWLDAQVTRGDRNGERGWGVAGRVGF